MAQKLLDKVRETARLKYLSIRTEKAYLQWIKRFILFHHKRHPMELGENEIRSFLTYLACDKYVSSSTQNQALNPNEKITGAAPEQSQDSVYRYFAHPHPT